ncbi:HD domain-containing phosphohydrolase [Aquabacterium sp. J223]|uniref:HD domain-containing phosphohydrolase n=1 Tax=Aquabacterium sp. J223 TaxID=2898431 RepID=UPI0021AE2ABA|nr:HD domain-containing phosphohydrolase [Aquabacterium sp. J223]UUX94859.1 GAF domain-containing protein [Aquabacterium sp. J223]
MEVEEATLRARNLLLVSGAHQAQRRAEQELGKAVLWGAEKLDALVESGLRIAMERDRDRLLDHLLHEGQRLLHCDAGTMYLVGDDGHLHFARRTRGDRLPAASLPMFDANGRPNAQYVSVYTAVHNEPVAIDDVARETRFDLGGTRRFDAETGYRTVSMLTVPVAPRGGAPIGVLQFINALDREGGGIVPFDRDAVQWVGALAAQAAVALDNLQLVEEQKALMESMIRVLANAIDAKSPYTGRHCERVPELAIMLAEAATDCQSGSLAGFAFRTEDEWQEFRIGAWLHDCGKITTPEYVIDKATKLETIHNRIHEVRTRFEVLLRDAQVERLQALLDGADPADADARFERRRQRLQDDFAFVAETNLGGESMDPGRIERLQRIGRTPWLRHFDDRLGLSQDELARHAGEPVAPLPATERLLADRPRDILPRGPEDRPDPRLGFRMAVPEHLYNRGELYNLSIERGTLTAEERYKINEHMVQTVTMLESMPFPRTLRRVPEYAGTHHETLCGDGYPRRLGAEQLSVPARIMAIADVFEALTAADRPYKSPKTLSEALAIMDRMKRRRHIDGELFDLFLRSGIWRRYAERHLRPEQLDAVDVDRLLAPADAVLSAGAP